MGATRAAHSPASALPDRARFIWGACSHSPAARARASAAGRLRGMRPAHVGAAPGVQCPARRALLVRAHCSWPLTRRCVAAQGTLFRFCTSWTSRRSISTSCCTQVCARCSPRRAWADAAVERQLRRALQPLPDIRLKCAAINDPAVDFGACCSPRGTRTWQPHALVASRAAACSVRPLGSQAGRREGGAPHQRASLQPGGTLSRRRHRRQLGAHQCVPLLWTLRLLPSRA